MTKFLFGAVTALLLVVLSILLFQNFRKSHTLSSEKLTVSFTSYVTSTKGLQRLELAESTAVENIERSSQFSFFWDFVKLPDLVVQARIPVRYLYYIDLTEPIHVSLIGQELYLTAPILRPGLPAADVSGISYEVKQGGLFRDTPKAFEDLRKMITPLLNENAQRRLPEIREQARTSLTALIKTWAAQNPALPQDEKNYHLRFADEEETLR